MNLLEHYIKEIIEERPLNEKERKEFKTNPDDWVYVKWKYNCYGSKQISEDYYPKTYWEKIKKQGYALM